MACLRFWKRGHGCLISNVGTISTFSRLFSHRVPKGIMLPGGRSRSEREAGQFSVSWGERQQEINAKPNFPLIPWFQHPGRIFYLKRSGSKEKLRRVFRQVESRINIETTKPSGIFLLYWTNLSSGQHGSGSHTGRDLEHWESIIHSLSSQAMKRLWTTL